MAKPDDPFLTRWSRRKRSESERAEPAESDKAGKAVGEPESQPDEAEIVAGLPDIDSLDENSDFTVFLRDGVPEALRRKALRKLWRSNPVFANLDGLNDYDEDFTLATKALASVKTIYQVGKGMISDDEETPESAAAETPDEPLSVAKPPEPRTVARADLERPSKTDLEERAPDPNPVAETADDETHPAPREGSARSAMERRWGVNRQG